MAEPAANLVSRIVLSDDGTSLQARKAYEQRVPGIDRRALPAPLSLQRTRRHLYVVDMYRAIIEHRLSLTVYLRDHIVKRKLQEATGYGRIYRVVHETTRRDPRKTLA